MRNRTAMLVARDKERHPEKFCPSPKCLWKTGGGYCPRHNSSDTDRCLIHRVGKDGICTRCKNRITGVSQ